MSLDVHVFSDDLKWSEKPSQYVTYMQAVDYWWSNATEWDRVTDVTQQKKGQDVAVTLPDGREIKLQFKKRRKDYGDICIEYRHDFVSGHQKPGWIETPSDADFLIYCTPIKTYRIEYKSLHESWSINKEEWISEFDLTPSKNPDYVTRNVGVPIPVLKAAGVNIDIVPVELFSAVCPL